MDRVLHQVADHLLAIEQEMRRLGIWEEVAPPPEALESLVPFCYDTLKFEQWLQWVFLPKMKLALEKEIDFPASSNIASLAEMCFAELRTIETAQLLRLLEQFDETINAASR